MQDRYAGDIGDFGKFGFLRALEAEGFSIGVNWYHTLQHASEVHEDGKYRIDEKYFSCDPQLASVLYKISMSGSGRTVATFPKCSIRDYFIVCPDGAYVSRVRETISKMLGSDWGRKEIIRICESR